MGNINTVNRIWNLQPKKFALNLNGYKYAQPSFSNSFVAHKASEIRPYKVGKHLYWRLFKIGFHMV